MEIKMIEYKNKKLIYVDYRGTQSETEIINSIIQGAKMGKAAVEKLNALINCEGVNIYTEKVVQALRDNLKDLETKTAIVGITGLLETVAQGVNSFTGQKNVKLFNTEEEAKDWLVS